MSNKPNTDVAQKAIENNGAKNFFFEHVNNQLTARKENLSKDFEAIKNRLFNSLSKSEFELLGMFSFLMGVDYTSQAYPQKKILTNVKARFDSLKIEDSVLEQYFNIMRAINKEHENNPEIVDVLIKEASESLKSQYTKVIEVPNEKKVDLKLIKSQLNKFLDNIQIPIGYSSAVVEFKKNDLSYESLLKANDILNNQGVFTGNSVKKFVELYGNEFFIGLLNNAGKYFNDTKFSIVYEESIVSVLETINRFDLCINPDKYTDDEYASIKEDYEKKEQERIEKLQREKEANKTEEYVQPQFNGEDISRLMNEAPDEFVVLNLLDNIKKNKFESANEVVSAIDCIIAQTDFVQHMFTYIKKNQDNPNRCVGATAISNIPVEDIITALEVVIAIESDTYKELAEANCAEIPSEQLNHIVTLVNEVIRGCILKTQDQKQYLISQLTENGITTWNHLQQIMTIIETCDIYGESASNYDNLYNYTQEKTNIQEIFESAKKLNDTQIKLSVYHAFKNWFAFHSVKPELEENTETVVE